MGKETEEQYCRCKTCVGDFGQGTDCGNELDIGERKCGECKDGYHIKEYRFFCETTVYARDEESAYELGYQDIKDEDYQLEEL